MGVGLVVGGIILLIIGIGVYTYLGSLKNQAEQGLAECQSLLGQAGQFLSPDISQKCQQAQQYTPALQAGYYLGIAFAALGLILVIIGGIGIAMRAGKGDGQKVQRHIDVQGSNELTKGREIFCRSCGKKRQISGEYCPFCGKSSRSLATTMKQCINCDSLTGEDSLFCANCGHQDFRQALDHTPVTDPKEEIGKSIHSTIENSSDVANIPVKDRLKFLTSSRFLIVIAGIAIAVIIIVLISINQ
jgi:RNA polymerase subunit RPABC4/transcription elongation factor Spt4